VILAFHALTGSDSTSYISFHNKKTFWNVIEEHHGLMEDLGRGILSPEAVQKAELFF